MFSFNQAQERARAFFAKRAKELSGEIETHAGPYTVALALADYFAARTARGSKGVKADKHAADARIAPKLGTVEVAKLTTRQIREWHVGLAAAARLVRSKKGAAERATKNHDEDDPDAVRARRATANRVLTVLKAALNHSYHEKHAASDEAWRKVKPFREVDAAVVRFLERTSAYGWSTPASPHSARSCAAPWSRVLAMANWPGCVPMTSMRRAARWP